MKDALKEGKLPFFVALGAAFILSYIPLARAPFSWMMTYFHEISHGLAAIATGGSVINIKLHLTGSGVCTSSGGIRFIVAFMGYAGATLWGTILYLTACNLNKKYSDEACYVIALTIIVTAALWARDLVTVFIMAVMVAVLFTFARMRNSAILKMILQISALYIVLDAVKAPTYLMDGRHFGDGATLSDLTSVPEIFWAMIWFGGGLAALFYLYRSGKK